MYTQVWDSTTNAPSETMVQRDADHAWIPFDDDNADYREYQAWLAEGNTPTPAKKPAAPTAAVIATSAQSLQFSDAKRLAAQGRTDEAVKALIDIMEQRA